MSQFQTQSQSQWENDEQLNITVNDESATKPKGISVNKRGFFIGCGFLALVIIGLSAIYIFGRPIEGVWVRQLDSNSTLAGMTVEVRKDRGSLEGEIITMPENAYAFGVGQIKWHKIKKVGFGKYECYDLSHTDGTNFYSYADKPSVLIISPDGKQLTLKAEESNADRGNFQVWIKQK